MSATKTSLYLDSTRSSVDVPSIPYGAHEKWVVKRTQDLLVSKPMPFAHSAIIGILMHYRFQDGVVMLVRLHELLYDKIPAIIASMTRLHGRVIAITAPEEAEA